jgi:hypothetical protein
MLTTTLMVIGALAVLLCGAVILGQSAPLVRAAETASNRDTSWPSVAFDDDAGGADAGYDSGGGGD